MTTLIRPQSCLTCALKERDSAGDLYCRARPPIVTPVIAVGKEGPQLMGSFSTFPKVEPDWWCGEWSGVTARTDAVSIAANKPN